MVTKIQKWGNSLGLRIPRAFAEETGIGEGSPVDISLEGNSLVIRTVQKPRYKLTQLLTKVKKSNLHGEISTGAPVGRENW